MSDAQKLINEVLRRHGLRCATHRECSTETLAAEIDKALGGLTLEWGSQMLGDEEITVGTEGTARFCAEQHPLTWTALSRWVSGWSEAQP